MILLRAWVLSAVVMPVAVHAQAFFQTKNDNPLLRGIYLPMPSDLARDANGSLTLSLATANTINVEERASEHLFVDGEATTLRIAYDARLAADWRYRLSLPVTRDSGGILDSTIDRWHSWFGLPRGDRPFYPRNQLSYSYAGNAAAPANLVSLHRSHTDIGDVAGELGWYAVDDDSHCVSLWGGVEAPTGKASQLTGDGAWDASLWLHGVTRYRRFRFGGEAGVVQAFGDAVFGGAARRASVFGRGAVTWVAGSHWSWRAQLEAQSARIKDTRLRFLGPSVVLSAGAEVKLSDRWQLQAGFSEDVAVNTAPDVAFFLGLRRAATR